MSDEVFRLALMQTTPKIPPQVGKRLRIAEYGRHGQAVPVEHVLEQFAR